MTIATAVATAGTKIRSARWNNIPYLLNGSPGYGDAVLLNQYTNASVPALTVKNLSASGTHLSVLGSDGNNRLAVTNNGLVIATTGFALSDGGGISSVINDKWDAGRRVRLTDTITGTAQEPTFSLVVSDQNVADATAGLNSTLSVQTQYGATAAGASAAYHAVFSTYSDAVRTVWNGGNSWDQNSLIGLGWARGTSNAAVRGLVGEARISSTSSYVYAVGAELYAGNFLNAPAGIYTGAAGSDLYRKTMALAVEGGSGLSNASGVVTVTTPKTLALNADLTSGTTSLVLDWGSTVSSEANDAAVAASDLAYPISSGTTPYPNPMYITLTDGTKQEIVAVTAIGALTGSYPSMPTRTLTITRGQEGTTAATTTFTSASTTVTRALFSSAGIGVGLGGVQDGFRRGLVFPKFAIAPAGVGLDMRFMFVGGNQKPIMLPNTGWLYGGDTTTAAEVGLIRLNSSNNTELHNSAVAIANTTFTFSGSSAAGTAMSLLVAHTNNSDPASHAYQIVQAGGTSGGDALTIWRVGAAGNAYGAGVDNTDDSFAIAYNAAGVPALGTNNRFRIDTAGNVSIGAAALATNATDGHFFIPTCAGTPTGVPTAHSGRVAMIFDTTNNELYIYDGAWISTSVFA